MSCWHKEPTLIEHAKTFPHKYGREGSQSSNSSIHIYSEQRGQFYRFCDTVLISSSDYISIIADFFLDQ